MTIFLLLFIVWATAHSITASSRFKGWARQRLGFRAYDGLYRLLYNGLALVTLLPVLAAGALFLPSQTLWQTDPPLTYLFIAIQLAGVVGLGISLLQTDILRFLGVSQFIRYLRGEAVVNPDPVLTTTGAYRIVRHPLYFFSLLLLWFAPIMTFSLLLFNIGATIYFWVGSGYEERRLVLVFGERYEAYRRAVPRLLPIKLRA